jgi:hypothetical protein
MVCQHITRSTTNKPTVHQETHHKEPQGISSHKQTKNHDKSTRSKTRHSTNTQKNLQRLYILFLINIFCLHNHAPSCTQYPPLQHKQRTRKLEEREDNKHVNSAPITIIDTFKNKIYNRTVPPIKIKNKSITQHTATTIYAMLCIHLRFITYTFYSLMILH